MEFRRVVKESQSENGAPRRVYPDDFARIVSKIAVVQVCEGVGFDCVKQSALVALSNVVVQYICDFGKLATFYANLGRRTECNVFDIIKSLEKLGCSGEFSDGSVVSSRVIKEISRFVGMVDDTPFAQPNPRFPVVKSPRLLPSFSEMGESLSGKHIPDWLPAFPDCHTYKQSPVWNERNKGVKDEKGKQRRKAERSLMNLQRRLSSHGLAPCSSSPLSACEKGGPMVVLPVIFAKKGYGFARETFASVIDALKGGALDVDRRVASERKPVVHFKLKAGKKMLIQDLDVHLQNSGNVRKRSWFRRDNEKDYKKRRVEQILRQSLEYNQSPKIVSN